MCGYFTNNYMVTIYALVAYTADIRPSETRPLHFKGLGSLTHQCLWVTIAQEKSPMDWKPNYQIAYITTKILLYVKPRPHLTMNLWRHKINVHNAGPSGRPTAVSEVLATANENGS